jgi:hypothetical protein
METQNSKNYEMHKRRELMADERRYIIYYTFGENSGSAQTKTKIENPEPVAEMTNSDTETRNT